jgi:hypothetical protein
MGNPLSQAGVFRGQIISYGLYEPGKDGSQSLAISVVAHIQDAWDGEKQEWIDWREYELEGEGDLWIVKRTGELIQNQINNLVKHAGWDGDVMSVAERRWVSTPCQFVVNEEKDPNGKYDTKFKIAFINAWDSVPGAGRQFLDPQKAKAIADRYGPQLRALTGSIKQNSVVPSTKKPSIPSKPIAPKQQEINRLNQSVPDPTGGFDNDINAELNQQGDDIPF